MDGTYRVGEPVIMGMRTTALIVAFGGLVLAAFVLVLNRGEGNHQISVTQMPIEDLPSQTNEAVKPAPSQPVRPALRPVAPEIVAVPVIESHLLERVEPRGALAEVEPVVEDRQEPSVQLDSGRTTPKVLHKPVALAAGKIEAQGHKIILADIIPTDVNEKCRTSDREWPCGSYARTAFRNWLRGRALTCSVPEQATSDTILAECMLGNLNAAEWLVEHGWARAKAGSAFLALEDIAREEKRGLFGTSPSLELPPSSLTMPVLDITPETNNLTSGN